MKIKVYVEGWRGNVSTRIIEVDDDSTDDEIEQAARTTFFEEVDYTYEVIDDES